MLEDITIKPYTKPKTPVTKENIDKLISKIIEFLIEKTRFGGIQYDQYNPINIYGIRFWFEQVEDVPHLKFTKNPIQWDLDAMEDDLNEQERILYINKGVGLGRR